jgi:hypothetical protein
MITGLHGDEIPHPDVVILSLGLEDAWSAKLWPRGDQRSLSKPSVESGGRASTFNANMSK